MVPPPNLRPDPSTCSCRSRCPDTRWPKAPKKSCNTVTKFCEWTQQQQLQQLLSGAAILTHQVWRFVAFKLLKAPLFLFSVIWLQKWDQASNSWTKWKNSSITVCNTVILFLHCTHYFVHDRKCTYCFLVAGRKPTISMACCNLSKSWRKSSSSSILKFCYRESKRTFNCRVKRNISRWMAEGRGGWGKSYREQRLLH